MKNIGLIACLILGSLTSCMATSARISAGVYREPAKIEMVAVDGEIIEFQIRVVAGDQDRIVNRKYKYALRPDGKIRVFASSNDSAFVFGVMKYDWSWDGKNVVRKDPKAGEVVTFAREANARK
jgi:hypothetical protein